MTISIIGSGNVATFYATRLFAQGVAIQQVYSPNVEHANILAKQVQAVAINDLEQINASVDAFIVAVSDDAFSVIAACDKLQNVPIVHCSGTKSVHTFERTSKLCGIIWPVYSVRKHDLPKALDIPLVIDYLPSEQMEHLVHSIAQLISSNITFLDDNQRQYLHLNAVLVNNFSNHLLSITEQICQEQQLPYDILVPIIQQGFKDVGEGGFNVKQTGPAIRKDFSTITKHEAMLDNHPEWLSVYKALTASILKDAK